jgi:thiamine-phosphate pyrophosphorylase
VTEARAKLGGRKALTFGGLHVLVDDDSRWPRDPVEQGRAALAGGAHVIQLRAKHTPDREVLIWSEELRRLTRSAGALFFVNDRFDLALCADADGVHLGQGDIPPAAIPKSLRERLFVGRSTHTFDQIDTAMAEGVDYIAFGPIFETQSKVSAHPPQGLARLREAVARATPKQLIAIGAIGAQRVESIAKCGAAGFAVIGAVASAADPEISARSLVERFTEFGK